MKVRLHTHVQSPLRSHAREKLVTNAKLAIESQYGGSIQMDSLGSSPQLTSSAALPPMRRVVGLSIPSVFKWLRVEEGQVEG